MRHLTLDQLIAKLQQLKESGVPGDIAVAIPALDNNGRGGVMQRIEGAGRVAVAKADMDKGYDLCKTVATRGVEIVVIR
ncbi:hypothetical protein [Duganella vulcania]|uniref:Uncharacterized protein n=1 Tax=Duganella vulcania TaxID=2692166 RepID=A0A845GHZ5_9BURK|nr:hypothetical protein [Duganella vulcania]MYM92387.1 hypothetical protein [Duganella vulcania]